MRAGARWRWLVASAALWALAGCRASDSGVRGQEGEAPPVVAAATCGRLAAQTPDGCAPWARPEGIEAREVSFAGVGGVRLAGTLTAPRWAQGQAPSGPLPAVVLIHGSGPQSRDGHISGDLKGRFIEPVPLLAGLAEALSSRGFVVLRYDKRTCTALARAECRYAPEVARAAGWDELAGDVEAAAGFLAAQPGVDARDLVLMGHSQGATLALQVQGRLSPPPAAVVLLSGTFGPIDRLIARQLAWLRAQRAGDEASAAMLAEIETLGQGLAAIRRGTMPDGFIFLNAPARFWRDWIRASAQTPGLLGDYRGPVLYVAGGDDQNVDAIERQQMMEALAGRSGARAVELGGLSHALHRRDAAGRIDASALEAIVGWLEAGGPGPSAPGR